MPLLDRIYPFGQRHAGTDRGHWTDDRGHLHEVDKEISRQHDDQFPITCELSVKGRKHELISPNGYTELLFLNETTVYSADHRPCAEYHRKAFNAFMAVWVKHIPEQKDLSVVAIDRVLHATGRTRTIRKAPTPHKTSIGHTAA